MEILIIYVIKTLLLPVASLLFLCFLGLLLLRQRNFAVILICFALTTLLILSLPVVAKYIAISQETHPPIDIASLDEFKPQAIVIVGGGLRGMAPEYPQQVTLSDNSLTRIRYGSLLARQTGLPILVSGGKVIDDALPSEAEVMAKVLYNEFSQTVQWQEHESRNTEENALYTSKILNTQGIKRIILVTHAFHMPRAVLQFQHQGLQVKPAPTVFFSKTRPLNILSFIPSVSALSLNTLFIHEMMGRTWMTIKNYKNPNG